MISSLSSLLALFKFQSAYRFFIFSFFTLFFSASSLHAISCYTAPCSDYETASQSSLFDSVGYLTMRNHNSIAGKYRDCSAVLISERFLLTAAHCVDRVFLSDITFSYYPDSTYSYSILDRTFCTRDYSNFSTFCQNLLDGWLLYQRSINITQFNATLDKEVDLVLLYIKD